MAIGEFDLIRRFFTPPAVADHAVRLGVGDDCALIHSDGRDDLAVTVDTLVAGVHFPPDTNPVHIGFKALAVNLSDLAAMGAKPRWVTLALTLPSADELWVERFAEGFFRLATRYAVHLIGGDTTRGPLAVTVQAMGSLPAGRGLRRSGARTGDLIYVSGSLGGAGLGLLIRLGKCTIDDPGAVRRLEEPEPRITLGQAMLEVANACIDISDGLAADLGHILVSSRVGAVLEWDKLPLTSGVRQYLAATGDDSLVLSAGDDYELCLTVPPQRQAEAEQLAIQAGTPITQIGVIDAHSGLRLVRSGRCGEIARTGYQHFVGRGGE